MTIRKVSRSDLRIIRKHRANAGKQLSIKGNSEIPRVVISISNRYLRAQAIDDKMGHTILFMTTENLSNDSEIGTNTFSKKNQFYVRKLANDFANELLKMNKNGFLFDRNGRRFQGRTKYFCDLVKEFISVHNKKKNDQI